MELSGFVHFVERSIRLEAIITLPLRKMGIELIMMRELNLIVEHMILLQIMSI